MLLYDSRLAKAPVMSLHTGGAVGTLLHPVIDPSNLEIIAYSVDGPLLSGQKKYLRTEDIREIGRPGIIIDSIDELIEANDVIKVEELIDHNFKLLKIKVRNQRKKTIGRVTGYTIDTDDFMIQQISVSPGALRSLSSTSRLIHRSQIREVNNSEIIIDDADLKLTDLKPKENTTPAYVNPFREQPTPQLDASKTNR